jgi:hypothetical protein
MRQETPTKWPYTWATGLFTIVAPAKEGDFRVSRDTQSWTCGWACSISMEARQTRRSGSSHQRADGRGWYTLFGPALTKVGYNVVGMDKNLGLVSLKPDFSSVVKQLRTPTLKYLGTAPVPSLGILSRPCLLQAENGLDRESCGLLHRYRGLGRRPSVRHRHRYLMGSIIERSTRYWRYNAQVARRKMDERDQAAV